MLFRSAHSSILAWRIPWTAEPGGLQSTGLQRAGTQLGDQHTHKRIGASQEVLVIKYLPDSAGDCKRSLGFIPGSGRCPGVGNGDLLQYCLQKSHGQRSLVGYRSSGPKELDMTEPLNTHTDVKESLSYSK